MAEKRRKLGTRWIYSNPKAGTWHGAACQHTRSSFPLSTTLFFLLAGCSSSTAAGAPVREGLNNGGAESTPCTRLLCRHAPTTAKPAQRGPRVGSQSQQRGDMVPLARTPLVSCVHGPLIFGQSGIAVESTAVETRDGPRKPRPSRLLSGNETNRALWDVLRTDAGLQMFHDRMEWSVSLVALYADTEQTWDGGDNDRA